MKKFIFMLIALMSLISCDKLTENKYSLIYTNEKSMEAIAGIPVTYSFLVNTVDENHFWEVENQFLILNVKHRFNYETNKALVTDLKSITNTLKADVNSFNYTFNHLEEIKECTISKSKVNDEESLVGFTLSNGDTFSLPYSFLVEFCNKVK